MQGSSLNADSKHFKQTNMNSSFCSYGSKSIGGTTTNLASRINMALSRIISNNATFMAGCSEEEEEDLVSLIDELNSHTDLTVKLHN